MNDVILISQLRKRSLLIVKLENIFDIKKFLEIRRNLWNVHSNKEELWLTIFSRITNNNVTFQVKYRQKTK